MKRVSDADLRLLRIFSTVAESRGFAAAQAALNLSAPSISGYITALEQRLGVRLCSRGRAGFALTDKGAVIYREAQRLFGAMDEFVSHAGAVKGRTTGTLRIGLVDCTASQNIEYYQNGRQECYWQSVDVRFKGWQTASDNGATPYSDLLRSGAFECFLYDGFNCYWGPYGSIRR